jgi:hypothetical protein
MRWLAGGPGGGHPVLDADLTLSSAGDSLTLLTLSGTHRPLPAAAGPGGDRYEPAAVIQGFLTRGARRSRVR